MKHSNYFSPNVKPTSDFAKRQWDWNFLRKKKKELIDKGKKITRKDFVDTMMQFGNFDKIRSGVVKVQSRKTAYYNSLKKKGRRVPI